MKSSAKLALPETSAAGNTSSRNVSVSTILAGRFKCPPRRRSRTSKVTPIKKFQRQSGPSLGQHPKATAVPRNRNHKPGRSNHKESSLKASLLKLLPSQEQEKIEAASSPPKILSAPTAVTADDEKDEYREESTSVVEMSPEELCADIFFKNIRRKLRVLADNVLKADKKPSTTALGSQAVDTLMRKLRNMSLYNVSSGGSGQSSGCNPIETQEMPSSPTADFRRHEAQSKTDMETLCLNLGIDSCAPNQLYLKVAGREDEKEDEEKFVTLGGSFRSKGLAVEEEFGCDAEGMAYHLLGSPIGGENSYVPEESGTSSHSGGDIHFFLKSDLGRGEAEGGGSEVGDYSDIKSCADLNFSDSPRETASHSRVMNSDGFSERVEDQVDMPSHGDSWFKRTSFGTFPVLEGRCADDVLHFSVHDQVALTQEEDCVGMDVRGVTDFCSTDNRSVAMCFPNLSVTPESTEESYRESPVESHADMDDLDF